MSRRIWKLRRRGQALVPVIFIMLILTTLAVGFAVSASREVHAGKSFSTQAQRFYAARGAAYFAASALAKTSSNGATYGVVSGSEFDANGWMQIGDSWVKFDVTDTAGMINLNSADAATLQKLPVFKDNTELVAAIMDWKTKGDQASQNGAKSDYYQALNPSYDCKSAPFDSVEELLLVKGMSPSILFGNAAGASVASNSEGADTGGKSSGSGISSATSANSRQAGGSSGTPGGGATGGGGASGANGPGNANGAGQNSAATPAVGDTDWTDIYSDSKLPLSELFTTTVRERNLAADGSPRININTATTEQLQKGLGIPAQLANMLVEFRTSDPSKDPSNGGGSRPGGGGNRPGGGGNRPGGGGNRPGGGFGGGATSLGTGGGNGGGVPFNRATSDENANVTRQSGGLGIQKGRPSGGYGLQTGGGNFGIQKGGQGGGSNAQSGTGGAGNSGASGGGTGQSGSGGASGTGASGTGRPIFKTIADLMYIPGRTTFDRETMQKVADRVTVDDMPYHDNLVNINTAPAEVLATVPGMDHESLKAILSYREGGKAFQTMGDLFSITSITRQQFLNFVARLCTKSSLYRVRIQVRSQGSPSVYAAVAMIEMTDNGPRIRQWREVSRSPGWDKWTASAALPAPSPPAAP